MSGTLKKLDASGGSLYQIYKDSPSPVSCLIFSHTGTRKICNDPLVIGNEYTSLLKDACTQALKALVQTNLHNHRNEDQALVLNLLRGGLNFGLREALADAYSWNRHNSAFLSAQRTRDVESPERWHIVEDNYRKVFLPKNVHVYLGDVVATGTSLKYGLEQLINHAKITQATIESITFFTIGGPQSEAILAEFLNGCKAASVGNPHATVVYLEGRFSVADINSPLSVKLTGTDLLRSPALIAPEFLQSQYESPSFPIERCTIYDAGSRAFWICEYLEDVLEYWEQNLALADRGMTYNELLLERFPELDQGVFGDVSLKGLSEDYVGRIIKLINRCHDNS